MDTNNLAPLNTRARQTGLDVRLECRRAGGSARARRMG